MYADATYADVKLGRAQLALRTAVRLAGNMREIQSGEDSDESTSEFVAEAVEEMGKRVREALATAESSAAAALTAPSTLFAAPEVSRRPCRSKLSRRHVPLQPGFV